jgi:hypothetical protein
MCKDHFDNFLKIDSLKEIDPSVSHSMSKAPTDECGNGSSQITTCSSGKVPDEGSSPQVPSEVACDESAIIKVMVSGIYLKKIPYLPLISSFHDICDGITRYHSCAITYWNYAFHDTIDC